MCATRTSASGATRRPARKLPILPRRVMTFKASNVLKSRILRSHQNSKAKAAKVLSNSGCQASDISRRGIEAA